MVERTFVMIKPDGVERGLVGECLNRFEKAGLKISGLKMKWVDKDFSKKHYSAHVEKEFYRGLEDYVISSPVVAFVLEGVDSIQIVRKLVGATQPKEALPGTIRGDFAHVSYSHADNKGIAVKNVIHASGDSEDAEKEIALWFTDEELHTYDSVHDKHILN
jgi:nucleoside-diphosphate kinase